MSYQATVLYPNTSDIQFDMDYYLKTHMPLVDENWGPYGLQKWKVSRIGPSPDKSHRYAVQATLIWKDRESLDKAVQEKGAVVFGDVPKFTNVQPEMVVGEVLESRE